MNELWYYWHESEIQGPFSGKQLVALAAAGEIVPDDIVWKEGIEKGVPAQTVQHLFVASPLPIPAAIASETTPAGGTPAATSPASAVESPPKPAWDCGYANSSSKGRAVAGKGAIIVGQDGKTVKFRMKCTVCSR